MKNRIKSKAVDIAARALFTVAEYKELRREKKYDEQIAKSQAKIGPYKPASIPVQIWA